MVRARGFFRPMERAWRYERHLVTLAAITDYPPGSLQKVPGGFFLPECAKKQLAFEQCTEIPSNSHAKGSIARFTPLGSHLIPLRFKTPPAAREGHSRLNGILTDNLQEKRKISYTSIRECSFRYISGKS